jgi:hypothetical protein
MARARTLLYKGRPDRAWYLQMKTVKKALTLPAAELKKLGVPLSSVRYEEIMLGILNTISRHGNLSKVEYPSAYLLHTVQEHWKYHGPEYYEEGKAIRNRVSVFMTAVEKARPADPTVDVLAQVNASLKIGTRKSKIKPVAATLQPRLF